VFTQHLVLDRPDVKVTLATELDLGAPVRVHGEAVLESGSDAVWFTFPDTWHDIGLFHRADGTFTGTYANIISPCEFETPTVWHTTDWFLDVWVGLTGTVEVLDADELDEAVRRGWVDARTERRVRREARELKKRAEAGDWPPPVVQEWSLPHAREILSAGRSHRQS